MQDSNPRSVLFVSGERVDRFDKAMASDADLVWIDPEDAVHPSRKQAARNQVLGRLNAHPVAAGDRRVALRINSLQTAEGLRDVIALIDSGARGNWLLLPKVGDAVDIQRVDALARSRFGRIAARIETPLGIEKALSIARAVDLQLWDVPQPAAEDLDWAEALVASVPARSCSGATWSTSRYCARRGASWSRGVTHRH
jgi:citrate lyase subunit beta/citryl-CoA lyase